MGNSKGSISNIQGITGLTPIYFCRRGYCKNDDPIKFVRDFLEVGQLPLEDSPKSPLSADSYITI